MKPDEAQNRYTRLRELGRGGMGTVDLVHDALRQEDVARKRMLHATTNGLIRLKREFRAMQPLRHPNLVALYELDEDREGAFFTMEAVHGVPLMEYCTFAREESSRGDATVVLAGLDRTAPTRSVARATASERAAVDRAAPTRTSVEPAEERDEVLPSRVAPCDFERLATVLPQILDALAFLHTHGIVHRDLKPANVMVRADGVVKVLDFGVLAELGKAASPGAREYVGTLAYMAPEQIVGATPTAAADLYALGIVLFHIIAGRLPFSGTASAITSQVLHSAAPRLDALVRGVPERYADACASLLRKRPTERPALDEIVELLVPGNAIAISSPPARPPPALIGRDAHMGVLRAKLDATLRGEFTMAGLTGPTGAGKTALAEWLADEAGRELAVVLRGAGRPSEHVAFNAIDGIIDELAITLARTHPPSREQGGSAVEASIATAATIFPVLRRGVGPRVAPTRAQAFSAIAELFAFVAHGRGLVLLVDDLQWADDDSVELLDHVVGARPGRVLLLPTLRDDAGSRRGVGWIRSLPGSPLVNVGPLAEEDVRAIVLRAAGRALDAQTLAAVIARCGGRPFLAELTGRALADTADTTDAPLGTTIAATVEGASEMAQAILAALIAADGWARLSEVARVTRERAGVVLDAVRWLEGRGLVRRRRSSDALGEVNIYHDIVRAQVTEALDSELTRAAHDAFADLLATSTEADDLFRRVRHLAAANRKAEASQLARAAAKAAAEQRAYAFAADLYALALESPGDDGNTLVHARATALDRMGKYTEAAEGWTRLAAEAGDQSERVDALLARTESLLAANDIVGGHQALRDALDALGERLPSDSALSALWTTLLLVLVGIFGRPKRVRSRRDASVQSRAARNVRVAVVVGAFNPVHGVGMLARAEREAVNSGAIAAAAWCDYSLSFFVLFGSPGAAGEWLSRRYLARASFYRRAAGDSVEFPTLPAWQPFLEGMMSFRRGGWSEGAALIERSLSLVEAAGTAGTFDHLFMLAERTELELVRQSPFGFEHQLARLKVAARDGTEATRRYPIVGFEAHQWRFRGDTTRALSTIRALREEWPSEPRSFQRMLIEFHELLLTPRTVDPPLLRRRGATWLRSFRAYRPLVMWGGGLIASWLALIEVDAIRAGDRGASRRRAWRFAAIASRQAPFGATMAVRALAYLEEHDGHPSRALRTLERAEREALARGQVIDAAIARYQRGARIGGAEGAEAMDSARALVTQAGASEHILLED